AVENGQVDGESAAKISPPPVIFGKVVRADAGSGRIVTSARDQRQSAQVRRCLRGLQRGPGRVSRHQSLRLLSVAIAWSSGSSRMRRPKADNTGNKVTAPKCFVGRSANSFAA